MAIILQTLFNDKMTPHYVFIKKRLMVHQSLFLFRIIFLYNRKKHVYITDFIFLKIADIS